MKNPKNNPHKHFVLFGCGLFAGFVHLAASPMKRATPRWDLKEGVDHDKEKSPCPQPDQTY
jgi:hypothetical protein